MLKNEQLTGQILNEIFQEIFLPFRTYATGQGSSNYQAALKVCCIRSNICDISRSLCIFCSKTHSSANALSYIAKIHPGKIVLREKKNR